MAIVNRMELGRELTRTLSQVNQQVEAIRKNAEDRGLDPYAMRDPDGGYVLVPLLAAKANLLHGLAVLNDRRG
jgi:hypothetical protein